MTVITTIQATQVLWDKTADKLYVWDDASGAWELFFVAADLVTNDALTDDLALKVNIAGDTMTGALEAPGIGINTAPDGTNKLSVKSNAALLAALETGSGGTGDIRTVLSKQAAGNTASFLFQNDFSGRAEIGLTGDDDFHFKVSPDGSSFTDALIIDKTTGDVTLSSATTLSGALTYGGVTLSNAVTGTGNMVLSANPTLSGTVGGNLIFSGNISFGGDEGNAGYSNVIKNTDTGASAYARAYIQNSTNGLSIYHFGTGWTSSGILKQDGSLVEGQGAGGLTLCSLLTQPICFAIARSEKARFGTDGSFLVGTTTNAGAGGISASGNITGSSLSGATMGVNAAPDTTNKLSVASSAILFNNIGNGVQTKLNKNAAGDTASILYQTGFSGRAEVGLTGDDDFHFKVSPDGSTFVDALVIDKTSGALAAASDFKFRPSASVTPASNGDLAFEATSNTSFKIKFKGSDGTVRAATLTLS